MNAKQKEMNELLKNWGVDDKYAVLTEDRLKQMYKHKCKEDKEAIDFIEENPYPDPDEMGKLIELMILDKYPEKPLRRLYYRDMVEKMYNNLTNEETVVECCRKLFNVKFSKDQKGNSFLMCNTNLYILHFILRYRYNTKKSNKKYSKETILGRLEMIDKWCHMHIEGWGEYLLNK
jgi:hypothetical protein